MDFDVDFNNGNEGCPIAVLSSPRCPKACKRRTIISICKTSDGEKGAKKAGQASMRVRRRVMDLRAILDNGDEGNTLAVLSSPRCSKACKRITIFSILKYTIGEKGTKKAGQASMRVRRRVMDLCADLDNGDAGCPLAVLSRPRSPKVCKRRTIISICKTSVGEKGAQKAGQAS